MISVSVAISSLRGPETKWFMSGENYSDLEWLDQSQTKPTEQEVNDEIARLDALEVIEQDKINNAKNDTEGQAFLTLMRSKTAQQRKDWLGTNVADPNVRKVLQGLMSFILWKVA